jgi:hypothetical protein
VGVLEEAVPDLSVYQRSEDVRLPRANPKQKESHVAHDDHSDQALSRVGRVLISCRTCLGKWSHGAESRVERPHGRLRLRY